MTTVQEAKELIAELCSNLYTQGHVSGTGGGISIKVGDNIVMAPSGVQKERMRPQDMFVLDTKGEIIETPEARPAPYKPPKLSECAPLFMSAYELRNAGAVLHGHSPNAFLATLLNPNSNEFHVTHIEMIKGIAGQGFYSDMVVPIIENTARECELTDRLREAIQKYPQSNAVLVRRHGVYVWGSDWIAAKTQFECYEYLFEAAVKMSMMGIDAAAVPGPPPFLTTTGTTANGNGAVGGSDTSIEHAKKRVCLSKTLPKCIVLDIEGTVAPISFVAEVLFPYARQRLQQHLETTYDTTETQNDIELLRALAAEDTSAGLPAVDVPPASAGKEAVIKAAVASCEAQMSTDRKTTALKALQGHIWNGGFASGELRCELFRDVPDALVSWRSAGIKTYIYSSGSRQAQRDLFGHTAAGDMRPYLCGFFDTTSGVKTESAAYYNIAESLGVDSNSEILFATDNVLEAVAAKAAGWKAVVVDRPGNKALLEDCGFPVITSVTDLLSAAM